MIADNFGGQFATRILTESKLLQRTANEKKKGDANLQVSEK
jgi:hypothetical protein